MSDLLSSIKDLLSRELQLCKTLRAMISRELEAIVLDGDMDELLRILNQKNEVISQLQLLTDSWMDVLVGAGVDVSHGVDGLGSCLIALFPEDDGLSGLLDETHIIADSINKAEAEALAELEKRAASLREQIVSRAHGRNAANQYAKAGRRGFLGEPE